MTARYPASIEIVIDERTREALREAMMELMVSVAGMPLT